VLKKILVGVLVIALVTVLGLFFWARSVFGRDTVRTALAAQLSEAIGQPVTIGSIGASVYPRVTVKLDEVSIGQPARIRARALDIGTDLRALLSRRIEHGSMRLDGARIELPLPPFQFSDVSTSEDSGAPVEIVSIDEIVLSDIEIVSGGRTLRGEVEAVPQGNGVNLRRLTLAADDTKIEASGNITNLTGPVGALALKANELNFDRLLAFAAEFSSGSGLTGGPASARGRPAARSKPTTAAAPAMNVALSLEADRATMGALSIEKVSGRARLTDQDVTLDPLAFGLFGGRYEGALAAAYGGSPPAFRWNAKLSGLDVAAASRFAGRPDSISGRLSGRIDLTGRGADAGTAIQSARGTARVDIRDGVIKSLGLVRTIIVATSMRSDSRPQSAGGSSDEPFSRLGATLAIANGIASTNDLMMESENLRLAAGGTLRLDGSAVALKGRVQLSEALTKQAGRDLVRYTQEEGRVTLPATITGSAGNLKVHIDMADVMKRAIRNRATEEVQSAIKKGLGGLFRKREK
jgi:uncharacterized protein involved in outer membrane biogenesis